MLWHCRMSLCAVRPDFITFQDKKCTVILRRKSIISGGHWQAGKRAKEPPQLLGAISSVICETQAVRASFHRFAVSDPVPLSSAGASVGYMRPHVSRTHTEMQPVSPSLIASAWRHLETLTVYKYSDCRNCQHQPCVLISLGHSLGKHSVLSAPLLVMPV